jgi:sarcosine oxidase subunit delta
MLLIHCPYCGEERPELEFRHAGEAHIARPASIIEVADEDFEAFLYLRTNTKGLVYERWRHVHGCGRFFNAVRDSVTDRFFTTYKAGLPRPDPSRFAKAVAAVEPLVAEAATPAVAAQPKPAAPARAPRRAATPPVADEAPATTSAPETAAAEKPKRKAPTASKPAEATNKASAVKADEPTGNDKPKPAPKRTRSAPVKKGEA